MIRDCSRQHYDEHFALKHSHSQTKILLRFTFSPQSAQFNTNKHDIYNTSNQSFFFTLSNEHSKECCNYIFTKIVFLQSTGGVVKMFNFLRKCWKKDCKVDTGGTCTLIENFFEIFAITPLKTVDTGAGK